MSSDQYIYCLRCLNYHSHSFLFHSAIERDQLYNRYYHGTTYNQTVEERREDGDPNHVIALFPPTNHFHLMSFPGGSKTLSHFMESLCAGLHCALINKSRRARGEVEIFSRTVDASGFNTITCGRDIDDFKVELSALSVTHGGEVVSTSPLIPNRIKDYEELNRQDIVDREKRLNKIDILLPTVEQTHKFMCGNGGIKTALTCRIEISRSIIDGKLPFHEREWDRNYDVLLNFIRDNRHLPRQNDGDIGIWLKNQRGTKTRDHGTQVRDTLSEERRLKLERLGAYTRVEKGHSLSDIVISQELLNELQSTTV